MKNITSTNSENDDQTAPIDKLHGPMSRKSNPKSKLHPL